MRNKEHWFLGLAFVLPVVVLLVVLSSLQLASASVEEVYTLTVHIVTVHIVSEDGSGDDGNDVIRTPDQVTYTSGTVVTLTAMPSPDSEFVGWSGDIDNPLTTANPITITMDSNKLITATFFSGYCHFSLTPTISTTTTPFAMHVFTLTLTNESCGAGETFVLTHTNSVWWKAISGSSWAELSTYDITLDAGASEDVVVTMTVHPNATNWMTGTTIVTASASGGMMAVSTLQLRTGGEDGKGCRYDINCNGGIDTQDVQRVAGAWPLVKGDPGFVPFYDYDLDDMISVLDIQYVAGWWPTVCPASSGTTAPQPQLPYTVTVSISPSLVLVCPGDDSLVFDVFVKDIPITETLGYFQFTLGFSETVLDANVGGTSINTAWLGSTGRSFFQLGPDDSVPGELKMGAWSIGATDGPSGGGVVGSYAFDVRTDASCFGPSSITIGVGADDVVGDPDGNAYYHVIYNAGGVVDGGICSLTVNIAPEAAEAAGCSVVQDPGPPYIYGNVVTLIANSPDPCWVFDHWSGNLNSSDDPAIITIDDNKVITAHFTAPTHTLAVNTVGSGSVIKNPDETAYICGEVVTLTAYADANARFAEWSGDLTGSANPITIAMDSDKVITATFVETFTLTYGDCGTVQVEEEWPDSYYDYGETITIAAISEYCYEFDGWIGDLAGKSNPAVITMTADLTFDPIFYVPDYTLGVNLNPGEGGQVTLDPPGGIYSCGATITATATPTTSWAFDYWSWSGALTDSSANPTIFTLDEESGTIITAHFMQYKVFLPVVLKSSYSSKISRGGEP